MSTKILVGDCLSLLNRMPAAKAHTCVTSPPYFGLRDYGVDGQIGLEQTPDQYVQKLVEVFREVRRVLRDDGTLWLNLGDSYATQPGKGNNVPQTKWQKNDYPENAAHRSLDCEVPPKNLLGIPWRVALALQADGWYLRQDIIWSKPNAMPESVRDRCTKAHEYIFLLSKNQKYYYDHEAVKEPAVKGAAGSTFNTGKTAEHQMNRSSDKERADSDTRNRRSVWHIATRPYKGAHFATFPPDLVEPCILAGCSEGGFVLDPFGGSGTTGLVANQLDRNAVLIELNPKYAALAQARIGEACQILEVAA